MTKKSYARQMRDASKKEHKDLLQNNTCWDDLNSVYLECTALLHQHAAIGTMVKRKELWPFIPNMKQFLVSLETMAADLKTLSMELEKIYEHHKDKKGGSPDPDEVVKSIEIYEHYRLFMSRHDGVVRPMVNDILDALNTAEMELNTKLTAAVDAQQAASDPTHTDPIDVSFKMDATEETTAAAVEETSTTQE